MIKVNSFQKLAIALSAGAFLSSCGTNPSRNEALAPSATSATVETVHFADVPQGYEAVGTVRSATSSVLGAQISGTVREIRVKPGDHVRRGEVLARLDDRSPRAELAAADAGVEESQYGVAETVQVLQAAEAERKLAEDTYHRYQQLLARNSITRQEFDGAEARYKSAVANRAALEAREKQMQARGRQAQSQQESARTVYSYSTIVSPIDGVVTAKSVDVGTLVMPGTPLLTVEDTAHYRLEASVPQNLFAKIHLGQPAQVTTDQGEWTGPVVEIVPSTDAGSRTFVVKVASPSKCPCRSGDYGKATFSVGESQAITVPRSAVVARGELDGVYVVNLQGVAEYRLVTTGRNFGERVEILTGLSNGERIATSHLDQLSDGARVVAQ
ncbi:MAG TPA: efflux RND transporter periplasmic adaptor subunit [Terriglobia bacterium]|nr:efflux RND transporter periplasmic adaptor subunit [Terriglobia bacterium]